MLGNVLDPSSTGMEQIQSPHDRVTQSSEGVGRISAGLPWWLSGK